MTPVVYVLCPACREAEAVHASAAIGVLSDPAVTTIERQIAAHELLQAARWLLLPTLPQEQEGAGT